MRNDREITLSYTYNELRRLEKKGVVRLFSYVWDNKDNCLNVSTILNLPAVHIIRFKVFPDDCKPIKKKKATRFLRWLFNSINRIL